ncbi:MAG TPA: hypothetical protein VG387_21845 [Rhizomicrobium sp.]|jgi:hypothetical protein|nr:hypothetical protein [Rhizomicrobium sp.]
MNTHAAGVFMDGQDKPGHDGFERSDSKNPNSPNLIPTRDGHRHLSAPNAKGRDEPGLSISLNLAALRSMPLFSVSLLGDSDPVVTKFFGT